MKSIIRVILLLVILGLLFLFSQKTIDATNSSVQATKQTIVIDSNKQLRVTNNIKHVYKTSRYQISTGGLTILEIDHGLPEQRVDTQEMRYGVDRGLDAAITLRVVDSTGAPVPDAKVKGAFWTSGMSKGNFEQTTNSDGEAFLTNRSTGDVTFIITKDGHYNTSLRYWFFKNGFDCAKNGRWVPWNPIVKVTLKEKRKPISAYAKTVKITLPQKNTPFGFDCELGELVKPYGMGQHTDLMFSYFLDYATKDGWSFTNRLVITAPMGGIQSAKLDNWSELRSAYEAPNDGFNDAIVFVTEATGRENKRTGIFFTKDQYLVFRTRETLSGDKIEFNFGKIYPDSFFYGESEDKSSGGVVIFTYFFNPQKNDRNIELNCKNTL